MMSRIHKSTSLLVVLLSTFVAIAFAQDCSIAYNPGGNVDNTNGFGTTTPFCSNVNGGSPVTQNNDCYVSCVTGYQDSGLYKDIPIQCLNTDTYDSTARCQTAICDASAVGDAATTAASVTPSCTPTSAAPIALNALCGGANSYTLSNNYLDFSNSADPTKTSVYCTASNTFGFTAGNVMLGCPKPSLSSYSRTGVLIADNGACSVTAAVTPNTVCTLNTDTANHYYSLTSGTTWASTTSATCPASGSPTYNSAFDSIVQACDAAPTAVSSVSTGLLLSSTTAGDCGAVSGTAPIQVSTGTCNVPTNTASHYYNFANTPATTSLTATCTTAGSPPTYTGPVSNVAQGCDAMPTAVSGSSTGLLLSSTGIGDCGIVTTSAPIQVTTGTCNVPTDTGAHYYNFASGTAATSITATCATAGTTPTYTSADVSGGNVKAACDFAASSSNSNAGTKVDYTTGTCAAITTGTASTILQAGTATCTTTTQNSYYDFTTTASTSTTMTCTAANQFTLNTNVGPSCDTAVTTSNSDATGKIDFSTQFAGSCTSVTSVTASTILPAGTGATCGATTVNHYYDFTSTPTTATSMTCDSLNHYTLNANVAAGCDGAASSVSPFTAGDLNYATTGSGTCAALTAGTAIKANVGASTCTIATAGTNYQFVGSVGSKSVTVSCTGPNSYTYSGTRGIAVGCGTFSAAGISTSDTALSSHIDTTQVGAGKCAALSSTNAIKTTTTCALPLTTHYYDFTPSTPSATVTATCSASETLTAAASSVAEGCDVAPLLAAFSGYTASQLDLVSGTAGTFCSQAASSPIKVGTTCKIALQSTYYDFTSSASPNNYILAKCSSGNSWSTTVPAANVKQGCSGATITAGTFDTAVVTGLGCSGIIADQATCVASCTGGQVADPALGTAGTVPLYKCTASSNTLTLQTVATSNICVAAGCQVPPALNDIYDFTAGTNACSLVSVTNRITSGGTCTLQCKGNTFPKGNVAPTFTCDSTTQTLLPTNYDICVPGSNLPVTMFVKGTVLPS